MSILGRSLTSGGTQSIITNAVLDTGIVLGDIGEIVYWDNVSSHFKLADASTTLETFKGEAWGLLTAWHSSGLGNVALGGTQSYTIGAGETLYWAIGSTAPTTTLPTGAYVRIGVASSTNALFIEKDYEENLETMNFKGSHSSPAALEIASPAATNDTAWAVVDSLSDPDVISGLYQSDGASWIQRIRSADLSTGIIAALKNTSGTPAMANPFVLDDDARLGGAPSAHSTSHTDGSDDIQDATASQKGLMTVAQAGKLDGIAPGAQVNTVDTVNGNTGAVVIGKADVGLGSADNTSDADKPISTATQSALDNKADSSHGHTLSDISDSGTAAAVNVGDLNIEVVTLLDVSTDHTHTVRLTRDQVETLITTGTLATVTSEANGAPSHTHDVDITFNTGTGEFGATISQASGAGHAGTEHSLFVGGGASDPSIDVARTVSIATDTILSSDNGKMVLFNYTSGNCVVTVPDTLPAGFNVTLINKHASNFVDFQAGGTMVVNSKYGLRLQENFASASLFVEGATSSILVGALTAVS